MGNRRLARQYALQTLYLSDTGKMDFTAVAPYMSEEEFERHLGADNYAFFNALLKGTIDNKKEIDDIIAASAKNWSVDRMSAVDRSILRMATYELLFSEEKTPFAAVIDEAIELSKKFSTDKSSSFINGLLDQIRTQKK